MTAPYSVYLYISVNWQRCHCKLRTSDGSLNATYYDVMTNHSSIPLEDSIEHPPGFPSSKSSTRHSMFRASLGSLSVSPGNAMTGSSSKEPKHLEPGMQHMRADNPVASNLAFAEKRAASSTIHIEGEGMNTTNILSSSSTTPIGESVQDNKNLSKPTDQYIKVELDPFQLLLSPAMEAGSDEMDLLRVTRMHLSNSLSASEGSFELLEVFQLRRGGGSDNLGAGYTMVAFGGSSYFDSRVSQDVIREVTMLAFLGKNLTDYMVLLHESTASITDVQLYTLDGHIVDYSDGSMQIEGDFPEEGAMDSKMSIILYIVAVGIPAMICVLICIGYCALHIKEYNLCQPRNVDPKHETWHAASNRHRNDDEFVVK